MIGKKKCRILKEIRQKIADENDIPYVTRECSFQGECKGTCPRCESELRYLEKQLEARAAAGKRIAIAALCAGMTFGAAGCASSTPPNTGDMTEDLSGYVEPADSGTSEVYVTTGEAAPPEDVDENPEMVELSGEVAEPEDIEGTDSTGDAALPEEVEEFELMGDVAYEEDVS